MIISIEDHRRCSSGGFGSDRRLRPNMKHGLPEVIATAHQRPIHPISGFEVPRS
jgi:hypothetical protein